MNIVRIQKARKKPVEVEFIQYDGENGQALYDWSNSQIRSVWYPASGESELTVETLEGFLIISINDYVIKDVDGEFYPCKPDIFHKTYDILGGFIEEDLDV